MPVAFFLGSRQHAWPRVIVGYFVATEGAVGTHCYGTMGTEAIAGTRALNGLK
jgi:hypothetical protein